MDEQQNQQPGRDLIDPATSPASQAQQSLMEVWTGSQANLSNLPEDAQERFFLESAMLGPESDRLANATEEIAIVYWYVHPVEIQDDEGLVTPCLRCAIIDENDKVWTCVSDGIKSDLARIAATFGAAKYDPPVRVRVVRVQGRGPNTVLRLMPIRPAKKAAPRSRK